MTDIQYNYAKENHAAAWTNEYVFNQLIPYIGNKRKLLGLICQSLASLELPKSTTFVDLFAGSGVVSRMAKKMDFCVISNDWEPYALEINRCYIDCNHPPELSFFGGYKAALSILNLVTPKADWVTNHLCPTDDKDYDIEKDRLFYTRSNGMIIDAIRSTIEQWEEDGRISPNERACLLAPMLYQVCYTSNTSGVFKGFHNGWGGQTKTALYRILSKFHLKQAVFYDNGQKNAVYQRDALDLARHLQKDGLYADVVYLDPPYNQHPYGSNYHVLNTVALWDKPSLTEKIEGRNKAAIREDWRTERRSAYNYRGDAEKAYAQLIESLHAKYILTSYSTDGMVPVKKLVQTCVNRGHTDFVLRHYKRYRVSSQRFSGKPLNVEFILTVDTTRKHSGLQAEDICEKILRAEEEAISTHHETASRQVEQMTLF